MFPCGIIDPHHHFVDPGNNSFQSRLKSLHVQSYLAEDYSRDSEALPIFKSIHIEATPDDGLQEALWISKLVNDQRAKTVDGIVAYCDLSCNDVKTQLHDLVKTCPLVRGIRMILDYDGEFNGGANATHISCSSHNKDFLRDLTGPAQQFEKGFQHLEEHNLSFDLQCCPAQMQAASHLISRYPGIAVCIDHLGKLRGFDNESMLAQWRAGLKTLAIFPNVYIKLSMLGYCVPGWFGDPSKEVHVKSLVREVIALFGPQRCMFASNWWGATSNSDAVETPTPTMLQLYERFYDWVSDMSHDDQCWLFAGSAAKFYKIELPGSFFQISDTAKVGVDTKVENEGKKTKIVVAGAGWWAQGWHLPLLHSLPDKVTIAAIIESSFQPRSTLVQNMLDVNQLKQKYNAPVFATIEDLLLSPSSADIDGIIICTPHSTHAHIGLKAIACGWNVLCEKPMTTDVAEAKQLALAALQSPKIFAVNNTANWRRQSRLIYERIVEQKCIGEVKFVSAFWGADLAWLFEDSKNVGWNAPSGHMVGNGMGWGQLSHTLAWIYKVTDLTPTQVFALLGHSENTGADIYSR